MIYAAMGSLLVRRIALSNSQTDSKDEQEEFARRVKRIVPVGTKGKVISLRVQSLRAECPQGRETD
jgi:hypothetical protein